MPICKKIRPKKRSYCIGDLTELITIQVRKIQPVCDNGVDFTERFTDTIQVKSAIETVRGYSIFDESNVEKDVTHHFGIRFVPNITFENWVEFNGTRFVLVDVENLDEANKWYLIRASKRGVSTQPANFA